jgi:hypothetical protein
MSKIVPAAFLDLVPKIEPIMITAITRIVNKQIGMMNLFVRYQGRLVNIIKSAIKNYNKEKMWLHLLNSWIKTCT